MFLKLQNIISFSDIDRILLKEIIIQLVTSCEKIMSNGMREKMENAKQDDLQAFN